MRRFAFPLARFALTGLVVLLACVFGWQVWIYYMNAPWTRDGKVRADIVDIAPDVSGLVTKVLVHDNQVVRVGDPLFQIDRDRFALALRQAEAVVANRGASRDFADAELKRDQQLSDVALTRERFDQVKANQQQAQAAYDQSVADRDVAKLNLERSEVKASVPGTVTNMDLRPGAYVSAGHGVMALVDSDTLRVEGYFEETKLPRIKVGDPVAVRLMGEPTPLHGRVESIAGGIADRERSDSSSLLADVNPSFTWVRLAQRVPVRVALDAPPENVKLITGRTATVEVNPGSRVPFAPTQLLADLDGLWGKGSAP